MSSSFRLQKRLENAKDYLVESPWSHYIEPSGSKPCHPDYIAQSIGHADGVKICHRKYETRDIETGRRVIDATGQFADPSVGGKSISDPNSPNPPPKGAGGPGNKAFCAVRPPPCGKGATYRAAPSTPDPVANDPSVYNGYNKFSADLYRPWRDTQIQMYNPYPYYDRRTPHQAYYMQHGYLKPKVRYNATGTEQLRTRSEGSYRDDGDEQFKFREYGYGYMKHDVPLKYDVTKLVQPYVLWKREQEYLGNGEAVNSLDTRYFDRRV